MYFTTHATRPTGLPEWMSQWSVSQSAPGLEVGGTAAQEPLWPPRLLLLFPCPVSFILHPTAYQLPPPVGKCGHPLLGHRGWPEL